MELHSLNLDSNLILHRALELFESSIHFNNFIKSDNTLTQSILKFLWPDFLLIGLCSILLDCTEITGGL